MLFLKSIILLLVVYSVRGEDCVTYSFEEGFQDIFNDNVGFMCSIIQQSWVNGQYADTGIPSPNELSTKFIAPLTTASCASSFEFSMSNGGVLEFTVYMADNAASDQLTVIVIEKMDSGTENTIGNLVISTNADNYEQGWSTQRLTIVGSESFQGYLSFFGLASENSVVLVDSFRYIPPGQDADTCVVYDIVTATTPEAEDTSTTLGDNDVTDTTEDVTQTTEGASITGDPEEMYPTTAAIPTTENDITTTTAEDNTQTTQSDVTTEAPIESCTTYNFETDYELHFFNDNYLCAGLLPWQLDNYTSIDIDSPNPESTVFITPHESVSCMNSFVFEMEPDGVVEANVYMDPVQALDHIIILAHRVTDREFDTTAGFKMYHPENHVFAVGWNVIRFSLLELTSFDGYLIFIGSADSNSTVLVDSIRYIPPRTPIADASCDLY